MVKLKIYKNRIITLIVCILFIFFCACFTSCANNASTEINQVADSENSNNEEISKTDNSQKYKEFDLSIDNFEYFFNFTYSSNVSIGKNIYEVSGVLNYAYYDNVIVTFNVVYKNRYSSKVYEGLYSIALNAAGYAFFSKDDSELLNVIGLTSSDYSDYAYELDTQVTVKAITGKIILF